MKNFALGLIAALATSLAAYAQDADLAVTKDCLPTSPAGTDVTYTITVFNIGPFDATSVTLDDPMPAGMTFVSNTVPAGWGCSAPAVGANGTVDCTNPLLTVGTTDTFTFVFHIPPATPPGTDFVNVATAFSATDPNQENDSGTATTSTPPPPQGDVSMTKSGPGSAPPGSDVVYTISVPNAGPNDATTVSWSDTLPGTMTFVSFLQPAGWSCSTPAAAAGGTITCSIATLTAGTTATFTLTGHIPPATPSGTTFINTATVTSANDPAVENNSGITSVTVSSVDLSVTKIGPPTVVAGANVTYTITIANGGPDAGDATLSDPLPPGTTFVSLTQDTGPLASSCSTPAVGFNGLVSCFFTTLANGASAQFTLMAAVGNAAALANTATAGTNSFDTNSGNNTATANTTVTGSADLTVTKTGPVAVVAGGNVSYTITLTNNGASDAANVSMTDTTPANTTFVSFTAPVGWSVSSPVAGGTGTIIATNALLAASASAPFTLVVNVNGGTPVGTNISNTANASTTTVDPNPANNSSTSTGSVATSSADLSITKTISPALPVLPPNTNVTYTITVQNAGPGIATAVTVTDTLPATMTFVSSTPSQGSCSGTTTVTCTLGTLNSAASATVTIAVTTSATLGPAINTATVSSAAADGNPANNTASVTTTIVSSIPALSNLLLALLAAALTAAALLKLHR